MNDYCGDERRAFMPCGQHDARLHDVERRCDRKEKTVEIQGLDAAKMQAEIRELKLCKTAHTAEIKELNAWKNKSQVYIAGFSFLAAAIVSAVKSLIGG